MTDFDFTLFNNVEITGVDLDSLTKEERTVLYQAARYCQAMTGKDIDTMREIVSEDMIFVHMSGMRQTREEYFADVADGSLTYYTIGMADPVIEIDGDHAIITYTSILNANAYGARGTFRMKGSHHYENRDGAWIAVNK
jgi:ketosteroid isomerase-like protein